MSGTFMKRGILALAIVAAAVFAVGIGARSADAQTPSVSANGPYVGHAGGVFPFVVTSNVGEIRTAQWSFGDGTAMAGARVSKVYRIPGVYTVTVTVTTASGQTYSDTTTATVTPHFATTPLFGGVVVFPQPVVVVPFFRPCAFGGVVINGLIYC
jgi:hypothetical protein